MLRSSPYSLNLEGAQASLNAWGYSRTLFCWESRLHLELNIAQAEGQACSLKPNFLSGPLSPSLLAQAKACPTSKRWSRVFRFQQQVGWKNQKNCWIKVQIPRWHSSFLSSWSSAASKVNKRIHSKTWQGKFISFLFAICNFKSNSSSSSKLCRSLRMNESDCQARCFFTMWSNSAMVAFVWSPYWYAFAIVTYLDRNRAIILHRPPIIPCVFYPILEK